MDLIGEIEHYVERRNIYTIRQVGEMKFYEQNQEQKIDL